MQKNFKRIKTKKNAKILIVLSAFLLAFFCLSAFNSAHFSRAPTVSAASSGLSASQDLFSAGFAGNTFTTYGTYTDRIETSESDTIYTNDVVQIDNIKEISTEAEDQAITLYTISQSSAMYINADNISHSADGSVLILVSFRVYERIEESMYEDVTPGEVYTYIYAGKDSFIDESITVGLTFQSVLNEQISVGTLQGEPLNYVAINSVGVYDNLQTTGISPYISIYENSIYYEIIPETYAVINPGIGESLIRPRLNFDEAYITPARINAVLNDYLYYDPALGFDWAYIRDPSITYGYTLSGFDVGQPSPYNITVGITSLTYGSTTVNQNTAFRPAAGTIGTPERGSPEYIEFINTMHVITAEGGSELPPGTEPPGPDQPDNNGGGSGGGFWEAIGNFFSSIWEGVKTAAQWVFEKIIIPVVEFIGNIITFVYEKIIIPVVEFIGNVLDGIGKVVGELPKIIGNAGEAPRQWWFWLIIAAVAGGVVWLIIYQNQKK